MAWPLVLGAGALAIRALGMLGRSPAVRRAATTVAVYEAASFTAGQLWDLFVLRFQMRTADAIYGGAKVPTPSQQEFAVWLDEHRDELSGLDAAEVVELFVDHTLRHRSVR